MFRMVKWLVCIYLHDINTMQTYASYQHTEHTRSNNTEERKTHTKTVALNKKSTN